MSSTVDLAVTADSMTEAKLPQRYEAAVMAIAECDRIDECKTWSDKAAALASYARQAKDDTLRVMAVRIQARALRRGGELLKRIEPAKNQHGTAPTRADSAKAAGLSERQRKTALRVASVPDDEFNAALESDSPPTVTQLAERGTIRYREFVSARITITIPVMQNHAHGVIGGFSVARILLQRSVDPEAHNLQRDPFPGLAAARRGGAGHSRRQPLNFWPRFLLCVP